MSLTNWIPCQKLWGGRNQGGELGKASSTHRSRKHCIHNTSQKKTLRKDQLQYLGIDGRILKWAIMKLIGSFGSSIHELIRFNKMEQYAGIYLLQDHCTCFGCPSHPSSGVHKTVTRQSIWVTTVLQCDLTQILWPVPEAAVTVLCMPDDGCNGNPAHVEWFCSK
jgi:hypothetical protein